jgi:hypothetical protein
MKRIIAIVVALITLWGVDSATAQSRTSYFMEGSYFRTDLNPALIPTRGYIALPGISGVGVDVPSNFLSVDNFIYKRDGQMVTALHKSVSSKEFLGRLPELGRVGVNANVNILGVGFYHDKTYWNFGLRLRSTTDINISKELFAILKTMESGSYNLASTNINSNSYLETYLGASFPVGDYVNIGVRGKFLVGLESMYTEFERVEASVGQDRLAATLRGRVVANTILVDRSKLRPGDRVSLDMFDLSSANSMLKSARSFGAALDLGVEVKVCNDHLKVSAAVVDLGFIKWSASTNCSAVGSYDLSFEGYDIEAEELNANFGGEFVIENPLPKGYVSMLNASFNVGVEYNFLSNHFALGLLSHTELYNKKLFTELTASFNIRATNWLSATVSHTFLANHKLGVLGAALNIHPRGINIFIGADFIDTRYVRFKHYPVPRYQNSLNLYVGIGFNFARPKCERYTECGRMRNDRRVN